MIPDGSSAEEMIDESKIEGMIVDESNVAEVKDESKVEDTAQRFAEMMMRNTAGEDI